MSNLPEDLEFVASYAEIEKNDVNDTEMSEAIDQESIAIPDQPVSTEQKIPTAETATAKPAHIEPISTEPRAAEPTTAETTAQVPSSEPAGEDTIDTAIAKSQQPDEKEDDGYESSDLSSSDDDDDDDDKSDAQELYSDIDDEEGGKEQTGPLRTKNELVEVVIDTPDFEITPTTELRPVGTIDEIIDNVIVVHSYPNMASTVLDMGTLFTYSDRTLMGEVFETFGPVIRPYYSVRFNSTDDIDKEKAVIGADVSYVPSYERTQLVPVEELRKRKYTDASNAYDEEIEDEEAEFSDDEKEKQFKQKNKKKKGPKGKAPAIQKSARFDTYDFDHALAAYEAGSGRLVQSYADLAEDNVALSSTNDTPWYMMGTTTQQQHRNQVAPQQPPAFQPTNSVQPVQPAQQQSSDTYQSPAELVSALLKSNGGTIPNLSASGSFETKKKTSSVRSLFDTPPPSSKGA